mmetsp:Transcript_11940/g.26184  ORF Transcript_11940/g.26184 Transcript_11940/m.26184 type:complete len:278 (-) Transcript_11940:995-1828(-)
MVGGRPGQGLQDRDPTGPHPQALQQRSNEVARLRPPTRPEHGFRGGPASIDAARPFLRVDPSERRHHPLHREWGKGHQRPLRPAEETRRIPQIAVGAIGLPEFAAGCPRDFRDAGGHCSSPHPQLQAAVLGAQPAQGEVERGHGGVWAEGQDGAEHVDQAAADAEATFGGREEFEGGGQVEVGTGRAAAPGGVRHRVVFVFFPVALGILGGFPRRGRQRTFGGHRGRLRGGRGLEGPCVGVACKLGGLLDGRGGLLCHSRSQEVLFLFGLCIIIHWY